MGKEIIVYTDKCTWSKVNQLQIISYLSCWIVVQYWFYIYNCLKDRWSETRVKNCSSLPLSLGALHLLLHHLFLRGTLLSLFFFFSLVALAICGCWCYCCLFWCFGRSCFLYLYMICKVECLFLVPLPFRCILVHVHALICAYMSYMVHLKHFSS